MARRMSIASHRGWVSVEADLVRSVDALDLAEPGWADDVRLLGLVRRLERDSSSRAIQAAVDVYGEQSLRAVLPRTGLFLHGNEVFGPAGDLRYRLRPPSEGEGISASDASFWDVLSVDQISKVLTLLRFGRSAEEIAAEMSLSDGLVAQLRDEFMPSVDMDREAAA